MNFDSMASDTHNTQERGCARLLASIISQAVLDASIPLNYKEKKYGINTDELAIEALDWLFLPNDTFRLYAWLLGFNPEYVRRALGRNENVATTTFTPRMRANLHKRMAMHEVARSYL